MAISIRSVEKTFGRYRALNGVSLEIADGELLALLGPSGSGKTTLLRAIAGLELPEKGQILFDGRDMTYASAAARQVGFVFQQYALFRHMTLARNIAFGLEVRKGAAKPPKAEIDKRVDDLLNLVELPGLGERYPAQLSGGQRQRVALARALARQPRLLLLDEPLGALDRALREETQAELRAIQRRLGTSFVVVTHDAEEAMALADRIGVMEGGRLVQVGPPRELYERPASRFVAGLLGDVNLIAGRLGPTEPGGVRSVETALGTLRASGAGEAGASVVVAIRPERLVIGGVSAGGLTGKLSEATFLGDRVRYRVAMADGTSLRASAALPGAGPAPSVGEAVTVTVPADAARVLPA